MFAELPAHAAFVHEGARIGFEVVVFRSPDHDGEGVLIEGGTTAIEERRPWSVHYRILVGPDWRTRRVEATGISHPGRQTLLATQDDGHWTVNGIERPDLAGCVDVDLESSLVTNTLPLHRLGLVVGERHEVPAAFVRADDLRVERLEQSYRATRHDETGYVVAYESSTFGFATDLGYDAAGLILTYPGLGRQVSPSASSPPGQR